MQKAASLADSCPPAMVFIVTAVLNPPVWQMLSRTFSVLGARHRVRQLPLFRQFPSTLGPMLLPLGVFFLANGALFSVFLPKVSFLVTIFIRFRRRLKFCSWWNCFRLIGRNPKMPIYRQSDRV